MWWLCAQSCQTLGDPMDCNPQGSPVPGMFQARILECVATSFSRGSSRPGIEPVFLELLLGRQILYHLATWEASSGYYLNIITAPKVPFTNITGNRESTYKCFEGIIQSTAYHNVEKSQYDWRNRKATISSNKIIKWK